jgi:hypothetical protein
VDRERKGGGRGRREEGERGERREREARGGRERREEGEGGEERVSLHTELTTSSPFGELNSCSIAETISLNVIFPFTYLAN